MRDDKEVTKTENSTKEELLAEFNETMVEPKNFVRSEMLEEDSLSYL